ncbi:MAG TPA: hypothetical protein VGR05_00845 [Sphingomicrobium sp.]|nr:hypothetical protein [Sphingomicrobium sp.]
MSKVDLKYMIVEDGIGGPPNSHPVLGDKDGNIIPPGQPLIFNKDAHKMRKVDHFRIEFEIKDFNDSPLRFPPVANLANAMWAQKGNTAASCPTTACEMPGIIWADKVHPQGRTLEVINMDMVEETFWFSLNLVPKSDPSSTSYVQVDPGGDNQDRGAPGSGTRFDYFTVISVGFTAGLVAFFGARLLLNG